MSGKLRCIWCLVANTNRGMFVEKVWTGVEASCSTAIMTILWDGVNGVSSCYLAVCLRLWNQMSLSPLNI